MPSPLAILILDGSATDAELAVAQIREAGFNPVSRLVHDQASLRSALPERPWDLVLAESNVAELDALSALSIVRKADPDVPFLVISDLGGEEFVIQVMKAGASDVIRKRQIDRLGAAVAQAVTEGTERRNQRFAELEAHRLAAIVRSAGDAVLAKDPDGTIRSWNTAAEQMYGWSATEAIGQPVSIIIPPGNQGELEQIMTRIRAGERVEHFQAVRVRRDGTPITVDLTISPLRDRAGRVVGASTIARDITARQTEQIALTRDAQILANVRDAVIATDLDGFVTYWNDGAAELLGWTSAETLHRSINSFAPPDKQTRWSENLLAIAAGEDWEGEFQGIRRDGAIVWIEARIRRFCDADGRGIGILAIARDISYRKRVETERDELLARLQLQIERMPVAYILYDADIRYSGWNPAAERIFGYSREEIVGQDLLTLVPPQDHEIVKAVSARLQGGDVKAHSINHNITKDGRVITCEWHNTPLHSADGAFLGIISMVLDVTERVDAHRALHESEERLRLALDAGRMGTFDWDLATNAVVWSDTHYELFGYPREDRFPVEFQHFVGRIHPDDRPAVERDLRAAMERGTPYTNESRVIRPDGSLRWVLGSGEFLCDSSGQPVRMLGTVVDITDRKIAEEALRASEERFRAFMDNSPAAAWITDADARMVFVSSAYRSTFRLPAQEIIGQSVFDLYPRDIAEIYAQNIRHVVESGEVLSTTEPGVRADDSTGEFLVYKFVIPSREKPLVGGVAIDITERAKLQAELLTRDRAIQAVPQGIVITDVTAPEYPIVYASPGFERLTGYTAAEVLGRNCRFLSGKDTDPTVSAELSEAIRSERSITCELLNYRKDGTSFWNQMTITPVRDENGKLVHFVGIQTDVSARRHLEDQLRQSQKMEAIGQLAGGIAHDFNNLLTIINGYCDLLLMRLPEADQTRDKIGVIRHAGEQAASLTKQLLAFSRRSLLEPRIINLNNVVREVERLLRRLIGADIILTVKLEQPLAHIKADEVQIQQALMNLALNARDAMPEGGHLTFETKRTVLDHEQPTNTRTLPAGEYVELSITDTGVGMTKEVQQHIFEPFFTTKPTGKGTGLGLAVVYGAVEHCKGAVVVTSEPGNGSTFSLFLPAAEATASRPEQQEIEPVTGVETVLLVEDADEVRRLAKISLEAHGFRVIEASSGPQAIAIWEKERRNIDFLVTDVIMPGMSGRQLAESLRVTDPSLRVLFVSGYPGDENMRAWVQSVGNSFLQKPYSPLQLVERVRILLDAS